MTRKQKKLLIRIAVATALIPAIFVLPVEGAAGALLFALPYLIVGGTVLRDACRNIAHGQMFDEQFLMSVATLGAFALGDYLEAVAVMVFYQVGELFQSLAVSRSRRSIAELMDIRPDTARVIRDGAETVVSPEQVRPGETVVVYPGEKVPLDGVILSGATALDTAALTGESIPTEVSAGDTAVSGAINLSGTVHIRVSGTYEQSTVAKILYMVENAAEKKSKSENFITRFSRVYTPCVVIGALMLAVLPPLFVGRWSDWLNRALIFLVVSCPCALVISVPLSFFGGIGGASRKGILIKGSEYIETLGKVQTVVFDKTGTLTHGTFTVTAVHPEQVSKAYLLDIAAAAEQQSSHPIARSIISAHGGHIESGRIGSVHEHSGMGVEAVIDGRTVFVGNERLMSLADTEARPCHRHGTVIHIAERGRYLGHIVVSDTVKPDSANAVASLKSLGVKRTVMLTGDRRDIAERVAGELGIDTVMAQLMPDGKVEAVEHLMSEFRPLAFVGDGINDAPVLTRADVGIAMGAMGSDAAIEAADIVLMDDKPARLTDAIRLSRRTMRIVHQNIVFAIAVKLGVLLLSACGLVGMWIAIFADVGVMVLAVLNAMRAMKA
ncbi:MAG: heavy metal translocating P-type ATPase [Firmicutes bacterium]|nr:heavy metal translocating P-type ATPase [Bacillota bacterium]